MTTRTITFTNLDDQQVTKTLCFHMNKMDKIRFGTQHPNLPKEAQNLQTKIESISEDDTAARAEVFGEMVDIIDDIIIASYGVRVGNTFKKTKEVVEEFVDSEEHDEFVASLLENPGALLSFLQEVFPDADFTEVNDIKKQLEAGKEDN